MIQFFGAQPIVSIYKIELYMQHLFVLRNSVVQWLRALRCAGVAASNGVSVMRKLNLYKTTNIDQLVQPEEDDNLSLSSSALAFFTDFAQAKPLVIDSEMSAVDARILMQKKSCPNEVRCQCER